MGIVAVVEDTDPYTFSERVEKYLDEGYEIQGSMIVNVVASGFMYHVLMVSESE